VPGGTTCGSCPPVGGGGGGGCSGSDGPDGAAVPVAVGEGVYVHGLRVALLIGVGVHVGCSTPPQLGVAVGVGVAEGVAVGTTMPPLWSLPPTQSICIPPA
jgi:hypothetical protein